MWCTYMAELLSLSSRPPESLDGATGTGSESVPKMPLAAIMQPKILKAEFNGAIIEGTEMDLST